MLAIDDARVFVHHQAVFVFGSQICIVPLEQKVQARGLIRGAGFGDIFVISTGTFSGF